MSKFPDLIQIKSNLHIIFFHRPIQLSSISICIRITLIHHNHIHMIPIKKLFRNYVILLRTTKLKNCFSCSIQFFYINNLAFYSFSINYSNSHAPQSLPHAKQRNPRHWVWVPWRRLHSIIITRINPQTHPQAIETTSEPSHILLRYRYDAGPRHLYRLHASLVHQTARDQGLYRNGLDRNGNSRYDLNHL